MVNFPVSLDTLTNPTSSSSTIGHADLHSKVNDIVEALMAKVGINNSNDTSSIDYILRQKAADSAVVHNTGDEPIYGVKTFYDVVNINGPFLLNDTAGERLSEMKFHAKNQANNGGVDWKIYADADNVVVGHRQWSLWGYPLKNSDGSNGGYERFITCSFPTYDGNTTYTKSVSINTELYVNGVVEAPGIRMSTSPGLGKVLTSDASGNATWNLPGSSQVTYTVAYSALPTSFSVAHGLGYAPKKIKMKIISSKVFGMVSEGTYNNGVYNEVHQLFTVANPPAVNGYAFATDKIAFMDYQNSGTTDDINYTMTVSSIDNVNVNFAVTKTIGAAAGALYAIIDFN